MNSKGFTLPEVMVALGIFAIGMIAAFSLQLSSMSTSRKTEQNKTLTEIATSELAAQRQFYRDNTFDSSTGGTCTSQTSGYACAVAVKPCLLSGSTINCDDGTVATQPVGYYVTVTITANNQSSYSISTLVRRRTS